MEAESEQAIMETPPVAAVEVEIEEVDIEAERKKARKKLERVYQAAEVEAIVETAAEEELPEEAQRERRAEIRKEPDPTNEEQGITDALSKIIKEIHQKTLAAHAAFSLVVPKAPRLPVPAAFALLPALYQKAIMLGLAGAALTLIMLSILV